jgi:hypothetical protein
MPASFRALEYPVWQVPLFLALLQQDTARRSAYLHKAGNAIFQRLLELVTTPNRDESFAILEAIGFLKADRGGKDQGWHSPEPRRDF